MKKKNNINVNALNKVCSIPVNLNDNLVNLSDISSKSLLLRIKIYKILSENDLIFFFSLYNCSSDVIMKFRYELNTVGLKVLYVAGHKISNIISNFFDNNLYFENFFKGGTYICYTNDSKLYFNLISTSAYFERNSLCTLLGIKINNQFLQIDSNN
jgi:hypothetical protein